MTLETIARNARRLAITGALALTLEGCITTSPFLDIGVHRGATARPEAVVIVRDRTGNLVVTREQLSTEKSYTITRIILPADEHDPEVTIDYYRSDRTGPRPLVVMSPPLGTSKPGGKLTVETPFLTYFVKHGFDTALVYRPRIAQHKDAQGNAIDPIGDLESGLSLSVRGYRKAVDFLEHEPNVRADRICALGISMGGILTTIAAGSDSRLKYTIIALAGSTDLVLKHATEHSDENILRKIAQAFEQYGGKDGFLAEANRRLTFQPQYYADGVDPTRTMLIISKRDKIIPLDAAEDLRSRMGKPSTRYIHGLGHIGSFLLYPVLRSEALAFYRARIAADDKEDLLTRRALAVPVPTATGGGGGDE